MIRQHAQKGFAAFKSAKPRQSVQPRRRFGQGLRLLILDHLQPVFQPAQEIIGGRQIVPVARIDPPRRDQRVQSDQRSFGAQSGIAPAPQQLLQLSVKFDFANPPLPQFDVESCLVRRVRAARAQHPLDVADLAQRVKIRRPPPDERLDFF